MPSRSLTKAADALTSVETPRRPPFARVIATAWTALARVHSHRAQDAVRCESARASLLRHIAHVPGALSCSARPPYSLTCALLPKYCRSPAPHLQYEISVPGLADLELSGPMRTLLHNDRRPGNTIIVANVPDSPCKSASRRESMAFAAVAARLNASMRRGT